MAFGKSAGPPASHHQLEALRELLERAGHADFRDARGPMGFNQRQAGGRFTRDEAQQFIDQLEAAEDEQNTNAAAEPVEVEAPTPPSELSDIPTGSLAAELRRRGYTVSRG